MDTHHWKSPSVMNAVSNPITMNAVSNPNAMNAVSNPNAMNAVSNPNANRDILELYLFKETVNKVIKMW